MTTQAQGKGLKWLGVKVEKTGDSRHPYVAESKHLAGASASGETPQQATERTQALVTSVLVERAETRGGLLLEWLKRFPTVHEPGCMRAAGGMTACVEDCLVLRTQEAVRGDDSLELVPVSSRPQRPGLS